MNKLKDYYMKHRKALHWITGLLLLYSALGFLLLPWVVEKQVVSMMEQRLSLQAQVDNVTFNPYTFRFRMQNLRLAQMQTADPLAELPDLSVNFEPSRLFLGRFRFEHIQIAGLTVYLERYSEADNTLSRLAASWRESATAAEEQIEAQNEVEDGGLIPLEVGSFSFTDGSVELADQVPPSGFETSISPINIRISDFSTRENQDSDKGITVNLEQGATLTWDGSMSISPLHASGHLALDNFSLQLPYRYLQDSLPFIIEDGRFGFGFDYLFSYSDTAMDLDISNLNAQLTSISARKPQEQAPFIQGGSLSVNNASLAIPENNASVDAVEVSDFSLALLRDARGQLDWLGFLDSLPENTGGAQSTAGAQTGTPWDLQIGQVIVHPLQFRFTDRQPDTESTVNLTLESEISGINNQPGAVFPYRTAISPASGGQISLTGRLQVLPALNLESEISVQALSLQPAQAYLNDYADIAINDGALGLDALVRSNEQEPFAIQGNLSLSSLLLTDRIQDESLLSLAALGIEGISLSLADNRLDITEILVQDLFSRIEIAENGSTNIGRTLKEQAASEQPASSTPGQASPLTISLGQISMENARSSFTDRSLPIVFETDMHSLNGIISGFSSDSSQPMEIDLEGQVDEFGLVQINGQMYPLDFQTLTAVDLDFSNLNMPAMSPYVIKFAGREIADGRVDVGLSYQISDSALMASNSVILRDLTLGQRIEHPEAMDLPLDLAVALLKNSNGVIDLEVPVSGDINDPSFSFGPVIRQAIANVIGNIVTAPFRLLGSLVGGSGDTIDSIRFLPGRSDIAPPEQEKLSRLIEALGQRPQLALEIPGVLSPAADRLAIQTRLVNAEIASRLEQAADPSVPLTEQRTLVLDTLYTEAGLMPATETLKLEYTSPATDETAEEFDAAAYNSTLRERLISTWPVADNTLETLARDRADAVVAYLAGNSNLSAGQWRTLEAGTAEPDEDGWLTMEFDVGVTD